MLGEGEYRYPGADLGLLVARSRMQTDDNELTPEGARVDRGDPRRSSRASRSRRHRIAERPHDALAFKAALT